MVISHWVAINKNGLSRDGALLKNSSGLSLAQLYSDLQYSYPKFFKMDNLCKWAWIASEYLFSGNDEYYKQTDRNKIAVALTTAHGCLDVDKRYYESISIPSPSLFVYTLPNIMLGEICIRHGFKGEQMCMITEQFDPQELHFITHELLKDKDMDASLCGWVDVNGDDYDIFLFWVTKSGKGLKFSPEVLNEIFVAHSATPQ